MARDCYSKALATVRARELYGINFGLKRMALLMRELGNPQNEYRSVQVIGTNGKSSTAAMCAALLQAHGFRTGCYTSPHLRSLRERIKVAGTEIASEELLGVIEVAESAAKAVDRHLNSKDDVVTQFELLTAAALLCFKRAGVEIAVVEAGLGGRLDATAVVKGELQVLTSVGLEHTEWLGRSEAEICAEKVAIMPKSGTLVSAPLSQEAEAAAREIVKKADGTLLLAGQDFRLGGDPFKVIVRGRSYEGLELAAAGDFQRQNFGLAVVACDQLIGDLEPQAVRDVAARTTIDGRLEVVANEPTTIFDGAHNPPALKALRQALHADFGNQETVVVAAVLNDKDATEMTRLLSLIGRRVVVTQSRSPRCCLAGDLAAHFDGLSELYVEEEPPAALSLAREMAGRDGLVLVTGSLTLLEDLYSCALIDSVAKGVEAA